MLDIVTLVMPKLDLVEVNEYARSSLLVEEHTPLYGK